MLKVEGQTGTGFEKLFTKFINTLINLAFEDDIKSGALKFHSEFVMQQSGTQDGFDVHGVIEYEGKRCVWLFECKYSNENDDYMPKGVYSDKIIDVVALKPMPDKYLWCLVAPLVKVESNRYKRVMPNLNKKFTHLHFTHRPYESSGFYGFKQVLACKRFKEIYCKVYSDDPEEYLSSYGIPDEEILRRFKECFIQYHQELIYKKNHISGS